MRACIGLLTPEQLVSFKNMIAGKNATGFFLHSREEIDGFSTTEKVEHNEAIKQFKKEVKNVLNPSGFLIAGGYAEFLCRCARVAKEIREAKTQQTNRSNPPSRLMQSGMPVSLYCGKKVKPLRRFALRLTKNLRENLLMKRLLKQH